jgi:hypothetical protein
MNYADCLIQERIGPAARQSIPEIDMWAWLRQRPQLAATVNSADLEFDAARLLVGAARPYVEGVVRDRYVLMEELGVTKCEAMELLGVPLLHGPHVCK